MYAFVCFRHDVHVQFDRNVVYPALRLMLKWGKLCVSQICTCTLRQVGMTVSMVWVKMLVEKRFPSRPLSAIQCARLHGAS